MGIVAESSSHTLEVSSTLSEWVPWLLGGVTATLGAVVGHWLSGSSERRADVARLYEDLLLRLRNIANGATPPRTREHPELAGAGLSARSRASRAAKRLNAAADLYDRIQIRHGETPAVERARSALVNAFQVVEAWEAVRDVNPLSDGSEQQLIDQLEIVNARVAALRDTAARFAIAARIEARGRGPKWLRRRRARRKASRATIHTLT